MSLWQSVAEKTRELPREKQQEVLDFVEFLQEKQPPKGPLKSLYGLWKDFDDITAEEIDEARREMWESFPRDGVYWRSLPILTRRSGT